MSSKGPFCITFAAPPGTSKTQIAYYLSWNLDLPIFSNDSIRFEMKDDLGELNKEGYEKRRNNRVDRILTMKRSFIYDSSQDREWKRLKVKLENAGFKWFVISLDFSKSFITERYKAKDISWNEYMDQWIQEHKEFLDKFGKDVGLHITEKDFVDRLEVSCKAVKNFIKSY